MGRGALAVDEELYRRIAAQIFELKPDVVGFTSLGCNFICTAKTAAYIRQWQPDLPILLGGPHATVLDRSVLEHFPQFDVIVRNEGENTILPALEGLRRGRFEGIPGVTWRDGPAFDQSR